ncbi:MAG: FlgD immunoglobulin-like domain containing protein, partial [Candidatus Marinimicrobia bacterium]|nr:FlgD immunoglobulin-like domain containing protein [Candidatus Neomarinimicrobiota bacterium]
ILHSAFPNPFNPSVTVRYELPKVSDVSITIYDMFGRNIWNLNESFKPAGYYSLQWNGDNNEGNQVSSGVYLISFSTPEFKAVQKAILIR